MLSDLRGNFERSTSGLFSLSDTVSLELMPPNRIVSLILKTAVDAILGPSGVTTALTTAPQFTELVNLQQLQVFVDSSRCRASRGSIAVFRLIARRPRFGSLGPASSAGVTPFQTDPRSPGSGSSHEFGALWRFLFRRGTGHGLGSRLPPCVFIPLS